MKVTNDVFALNSTRGNYVYMIKGKEIILIDSGRPDQRKRILKELGSMNIKTEDIKHILLTHHDIDHIGSSGFLQSVTGCKVWSSKQDSPYILGEKRRPGIKRVIESIIKVRKPNDLHIYNEAEKIGGINIIPTPGHTPGHVCLLYKDVLFAGDLIHLSKGRVEPYSSFWNWDTSMLMNSIKKIADLPFKWICPAHGAPIAKEAFLKIL